jgi:hypothetical protein
MVFHTIAGIQQADRPPPGTSPFDFSGVDEMDVYERTKRRIRKTGILPCLCHNPAPQGLFFILVQIANSGYAMR